MPRVEPCHAACNGTRRRVITTCTMSGGFAGFLSAFLTERELACVSVENAVPLTDLDRSLACVASGLLAYAPSYTIANERKFTADGFVPNVSVNLLAQASEINSGVTYGEVSFGGGGWNTLHGEVKPTGFLFVARGDATALANSVEMRDIFDDRGYRDPMKAAASSAIQSSASAGLDFVISNVPGLSQAKTFLSIPVQAELAYKEAIGANNGILARMSLGGFSLDVADRWIDSGCVAAAPDGSAHVVMPGWTEEHMETYMKAADRYAYETSEGYAGSYKRWLDDDSAFTYTGNNPPDNKKQANRTIASDENYQWVG